MFSICTAGPRADPKFHALTQEIAANRDFLTTHTRYFDEGESAEYHFAAENVEEFIRQSEFVIVGREKKVSNRLTGFLLARHNGTALQVDLLCSQQPGLGTALLDHAFFLASTWGKVKVTLDSLQYLLQKSPCRFPLTAFYARFGFAPCDSDYPIASVTTPESEQVPLSVNLSCNSAKTSIRRAVFATPVSERR